MGGGRVRLWRVGEGDVPWQISDLDLWCFDRYMNGAATNPDAHVVAFAAAQVKKGLDVAKKLGAENFGKKSICSSLFSGETY